MKMYVQLVKYKRTNYEKAIKQHQFNVFYSVFLKWYERYKESIEDQMNMRIAILHEESRLQANIFSAWKLKTEFKLYEEAKMVEMSLVYNLKLKKKSFNAWKEFLRDVRKEELNEVRAEKFYYKSVCMVPFSRWKIVSLTSFFFLNMSVSICLILVPE